LKQKRIKRCFSFSFLAELTTHHIIPLSRRKKFQTTKIKKVPRLLHSAWHLLFQNLTPDEVKELIKKKTKDEIANSPEKKFAWMILFGYFHHDIPIEEIINKYWS
jgi:hypothetical protein